MNMSACLPCYSTSRFIQRWCCLQSLELFVWTCTVFLVWRIRNTFEWVGGWEGGGDYSLILTFHLLTWGNLWVGSFHSLPAADLLTFTYIHLSFQTKKTHNRCRSFYQGLFWKSVIYQLLTFWLIQYLFYLRETLFITNTASSRCFSESAVRLYVSLCLSYTAVSWVFPFFYWLLQQCPWSVAYCALCLRL